MSRLRLPLKNLLRDTPRDPATVERMWSGTQAKLGPQKVRQVWVWAPLAAVAACLALWLAPRRPTPGPLLLSDGSALSTVENRDQQGRRVSFLDGSVIVLDPGTVLEPLVNDPNRIELALRRGRATFALAPNQARQWLVESGVTIEVMASKFAVSRSDSAIDVLVFDGVVLVRGAEVPGRVQKLTAHQKLSLSLTAEIPPVAPVVATMPVAPPEVRTAPTLSPSLPITAQHRTKPRAAPAWRPLAGEHQYDAAYRALGQGGVASALVKSSSLEELLDLADVARLSGHPAEAIPPLKRAVEEFPSDRRAAIAAFTRGRVEADSLAQPRQAADSFARAIELGLPQALTEDAFLRLVESRDAAGDYDAALDAMSRYLERFPHGRFVRRLRQWKTED